MRNVWLLLLLTSFISCCRSANKKDDRETLPDENPKSDSVSVDNTLPDQNKDAKVLKFKKEVLADPQGTGGPALSVLVPEGWKMKGQITWTLDNPGFPAVGSMTVTSPDGNLQFDVFPTHSYFYSEDPMTNMNFPPGSKYMGHTVTKGIPSSIQGIENFLLPYYRHNYHIIEEKVLQPEKQIQTQAGMSSSTEVALVRIEYKERGQTFEENIYATRSINSSPGYNFADWYMTLAYGFKAPKGKLKENLPLFQTMMNSIKIDKKWYNAFMQVSQMLINQGYKNIAAAGRISQIISETNDYISKTINDSYWQTQKTYDEIYHNYSNYIRGIDDYKDPSTGDVYELPSGYTTGFKNGLGEYIVTDDPSFDPSTISNTGWVKLNKK